MTTPPSTAQPLEELEERVHRQHRDTEKQRQGSNGLPTRERS